MVPRRLKGVTAERVREAARRRGLFVDDWLRGSPSKLAVRHPAGAWFPVYLMSSAKQARRRVLFPVLVFQFEPDGTTWADLRGSGWLEVSLFGLVPTVFGVILGRAVVLGWLGSGLRWIHLPIGLVGLALLAAGVLMIVAPWVMVRALKGVLAEVSLDRAR